MNPEPGIELQDPEAQGGRKSGNIKRWRPHVLPGFPETAKFIIRDEDKSTSIFRRFDAASTRNLLYLQGRVAALVVQQEEFDAEDFAFAKNLRESIDYFKEWQATLAPTKRRVQYLEHWVNKFGYLFPPIPDEIPPPSQRESFEKNRWKYLTKRLLLLRQRLGFGEDRFLSDSEHIDELETRFLNHPEQIHDALTLTASSREVSEMFGDAQKVQKLQARWGKKIQGLQRPPFGALRWPSGSLQAEWAEKIRESWDLAMELQQALKDYRMWVHDTCSVPNQSAQMKHLSYSRRFSSSLIPPTALRMY